MVKKRLKNSISLRYKNAKVGSPKVSEKFPFPFLKRPRTGSKCFRNKKKSKLVFFPYFLIDFYVSLSFPI